jgi:hypothetical protein
MAVSLYHAESAWLSIIYPQKSKCVSCVLCGGRISGPRKIVTLKTLKRVVDKIFRALPNNHIVAMYQGICMSAEMIQNKDIAIMYSCACCHHWFEMRTKRTIPSLPLIALQWHINTLSVHAQKTLDARPVFRLSKMLSSKRNGMYMNLFSTLFTPLELSLFSSIARGSRNEISGKQCVYYNMICVDTLLVPNGKIAELLRENKQDLVVEDSYPSTRTTP